MERLLQRCFACYFGSNRFNRWFAKRVRDMLFEHEWRNTYELKLQSVSWKGVLIARPALTIPKMIYYFMSREPVRSMKDSVRGIINNLQRGAFDDAVWIWIRDGKRGNRKLVRMKEACKKAQSVYYMRIQGDKTRAKRKEHKLLKLRNAIICNK